MMSRHEGVSRRSVLRRVTAGVAAPQVVPSRVLGLAEAVAPRNRITDGLIGTGSQGIQRDLNGFLAEWDAQVVAVCDVDFIHRHRAAGIAHLGNMAMMVGRTFQWGLEKEVFPGDEEAHRMLSRTMRQRWRL